MEGIERTPAPCEQESLAGIGVKRTPPLISRYREAFVSIRDEVDEYLYLGGNGPRSRLLFSQGLLNGLFSQWTHDFITRRVRVQAIVSEGLL